MGKNIQIIGERAFSGCELLKEVLGNAEIEEVGTSGFSGCINLQKVEFTVNKIDEDAFGMCDNLEEINFDSKIKYIGEQAFFSCKKLTSIGKQECLEYVGDDAFLVSGLTDFETSEGVEFGDTVLKKTPFLQNQLQYINSGVLMKYTIREDKNYIALPDGINSIDTGCVYGDVSQIQEIYIPDSVTEIKGYILDEDNKNVTYYIPASVVSIGYDYDDGTHIGLNYEAGKIVTTEGSYAQQYAKEHQIPCEIVEHIEMPEE